MAIRSLFSAVSGMLSEQQKMDIIGNNIANADTVGFKESSAEVTEASVQVGSSPTTTQPEGLFFGLGVQLGQSETQFTQGAFERTNVPSHMGISGSGFFTVQDLGGNDYLTRAGDFVTDNNGYLKTPDGHFLMGNSAAAGPPPAAGSAGFPVTKLQIPATVAPGEATANYTIASDGTITAVGVNGTSLVVGYVTINQYSNNNGLIRDGNNLYSYNTAAGTNTFYQAGKGGAGTVQSGVLELSNVDLATQFSDMIITQRSFEANARTITTVDQMLQTLNNLRA